MASAHAPSQARSIVAAARAGQKTSDLAAEARAIGDPYHAAWALFQLSQDDPSLRKEALRLLERVPQDWRRAELAADVSRHVKDDAEVLDALAEGVAVLPASKARSQALHDIAKRLPPRRIPRHLETIVRGPGGTDDAKTLLRYWANDPQGDIEKIIGLADAETRAHLLGYLHLQGSKNKNALVKDAYARAVAAAQDATEPVEVLRYLADVAQDETELAALLSGALNDEGRARLLARLVACADRLGHPETAKAYLDEARQLATTIPDEKTRSRLEANLERAAERLRDPSTAPAPAPRPKTARRARGSTTASLPPTDGPRPHLALHNGYTGGLGAPHIRAIARAAPLCAAYGLDLLLIGFPTDDLYTLVEHIEKDTRVGDGGEYARLLLEADRLHHIPRDLHTRPDAWDLPGAVVATTPQPDPTKLRELRETGDAPIVVMGLGPEGLPPRLVQRARYHVELTGHGISLETATAMGIIAERLRRA